jgi:hypothetical protein
MLPRLRLTSKERARAVSILVDYLEDESRIVRTCAMQALADLAVQEPRLRGRVVPPLESFTATGRPAMRTRGRKLLRALQVRAAAKRGTLGLDETKVHRKP